MERPEIIEILARYRGLLEQVDAWFARCVEAFPQEIACGSGCSGCCRGLFDITLLDAWFLRAGFNELPGEVRAAVVKKAAAQVREMQSKWEGFESPFILNIRPEEEWEVLMPEEDETPCPLLRDGRCLVYRHRPMTCRLHGIPLLDTDGEVMDEAWCTENFNGIDPFSLDALRFDFTRLFSDELKLFQDLTGVVFNRRLNEIDLFIPAAVVVDLENHDWHAWVLRYGSLLG